MAKKKKKNKLPKTIMGIKIPKELRSGTVAAALASPVVLGIVAEIIYTIGASASRRAGESGAVDRAEHSIRKASANIADAAGHQTSALSHAISAAVHAFLDTLHDYREDHADQRATPRKAGRAAEADPHFH